MLESLGLLLVGLHQRMRGGGAATNQVSAANLLLGVRESTPLLPELGGDVLDGEARIGLLDLQGGAVRRRGLQDAEQRCSQIRASRRQR